MEFSRKRILLVSDPELGQLNVQLATSYALLTLYPGVEVHLASSPSAARIVAETSDQAVRDCSEKCSPITFHALGSLSQAQASETMPPDVKKHFATKVSWRNMFTQPQRMLILATPWTAEAYVDAYREVKRVIDEVKPDVLAIDPIFSPAATAARDSGIKFHLLSPLPLASAYTEPDSLYKMPAAGTALPFPIPWHLIPMNIIVMLVFFFDMQFSARSKAWRSSIREKTGSEPILLFTELCQPPREGFKVLTPNLPEIDFNMGKIPRHLVGCGPIQRPFDDLLTVDPKMEAWLADGPAILISLGSHRIVDEQWAVEMAGALRLVLDAASVAAKERKRPELARLRILWKLTKTGRRFLGVGSGTSDYETDKPGSKVHDVLGPEIDCGRVKIVSWLNTEPISILKSGHIVCSVHHGGANSAIEALSTGVPQVVLPSWADCFDWASRVEYLGVGRFGNRTSNPNWNAKELGQALIDVICGPDSAMMLDKATALKTIGNQAEPGREVAARELLEGII